MKTTRCLSKCHLQEKPHCRMLRYRWVWACYFTFYSHKGFLKRDDLVHCVIIAELTVQSRSHGAEAAFVRAESVSQLAARQHAGRSAKTSCRGKSGLQKDVKATFFPLQEVPGTSLQSGDMSRHSRTGSSCTENNSAALNLHWEEPSWDDEMHFGKLSETFVH